MTSVQRVGTRYRLTYDAEGEDLVAEALEGMMDGDDVESDGLNSLLLDQETLEIMAENLVDMFNFYEKNSRPKTAQWILDTRAEIVKFDELDVSPIN